MLARINSNLKDRLLHSRGVSQDNVITRKLSVAIPTEEDEEDSDTDSCISIASPNETSDSGSDSEKRLEEFEEKALREEQDKLVQMIKANIPL